MLPGCIDFESGKSRGGSDKDARKKQKSGGVRLAASTGLDSFFLDLDKKKATSINNQIQKEIAVKNRPPPTAKPTPKKVSSFLNTNSTNFDSFLSELDAPKPKTSKQAADSSTQQNKSSAANSTTVNVAKKTQTRTQDRIDKISFMRAIEDSDESEVERTKRPNVVTPKKSEKASTSFKLPNSTAKKKAKRREVRDTKKSIQNDGSDDSDPDYEQLDGMSDGSSIEYETDEEESLDFSKRKK